MTQGLETELKYLGPDLEAVRQRLREVGAELETAREHEVNVVFDDDQEGLRASGRLLRLRNGRELTVKLPVQSGRFKARQEITVMVEEGVEALLDGHGLRPRWRYEKYRETWRLDGMIVTLDETPGVGPVVEVEGEPDGIDPVALKLGLDRLETSAENYRTLFEKWCAQNGRSTTDMTFEEVS